MEILIITALVSGVVIAVGRKRWRARQRPPLHYTVISAAEIQETKPKPQPAPTKTVIRGPAYVVDGDGLIIKKTDIRLFGVDAPEMNHPYGKKAKWALVFLCKGQTVLAEVMGQDTHGRTVARCFLEDGRDLSAEMVKQGLAIDWPKYSGGLYGPLEPAGIRKKLWLADARQKGRMHVWAAYEARQAARQSQN